MEASPSSVKVMGIHACLETKRARVLSYIILHPFCTQCLISNVFFPGAHYRNSRDSHHRRVARHSPRTASPATQAPTCESRPCRAGCCDLLRPSSDGKELDVQVVTRVTSRARTAGLEDAHRVFQKRCAYTWL